MIQFQIIIGCLLLFISCSETPKTDTIPAQGKDFCESIHNSDSTTLTSELALVKDSLSKKTGVFVLEHGDESMITRAWLSEHAEKTIDVQYFIFSTDNVGLIACDYLVRAADKGTKVRILVDDIMVDAGAHDILTMDSHENIEIKIYNPNMNLGKNIFQKLKQLNSDFIGANQRMHNKTFTVDGKVAITGGRNIADEYFDYDHEYNFRDRDVLLLGKTVNTIQQSFNEFWNDGLSVPVSNVVTDTTSDFTNKNRFERLHQYACNPENFWPQVREKIKGLPQAFKNIQQSGALVWADSVVFVSDVPGKIQTENGLMQHSTLSQLIYLVNNAKQSVNIQSPYLITTDRGIQLFKKTTARGVKVRVLTNSILSNDNYEAFAGYQKCRKELLQTGIRIFEFKPDAKERYEILTSALQKKMNFIPTFGLHAKSMLIDDYITVIGTFNLDPRSAYLNTECFVVIYSKQVAKSVLAGMETEFQPENSWEITLNFNPDKEASVKTRLKTFVKRAVPKEIL